ncbi:MAG: hypothetical protein ACYSU0_08300 [Planctomycetota bacterium]
MAALVLVAIAGVLAIATWLVLWFLQGIDPDPSKVAKWQDPNPDSVSTTGLTSEERTRLTNDLYLSRKHTWGNLPPHGGSSLYERRADPSYLAKVTRLVVDQRDALLYEALLDAAIRHDHKTVRECCRDFFYENRFFAAIPTHLASYAEAGADRYVFSLWDVARLIGELRETKKEMTYALLYRYWAENKHYLYWDEARACYRLDAQAKTSGRATMRKVREQTIDLAVDLAKVREIQLPPPEEVSGD